MYSKKAMPQLTNAATIHGFWLRSLRCAYHAKVMKTLLSDKRRIVSQIGCMAYSFLNFEGKRVSDRSDGALAKPLPKCGAGHHG
jgi:hypothetical protein